MHPQKDWANLSASQPGRRRAASVPPLFGAFLLLVVGAASLEAQTSFNLGEIVINPVGLAADPAPPPAPYETPVPFQVINMDEVIDTYPAYGYYSLARPNVPAGSERGLVMCFTGGSGTTWWNRSAGQTLLVDLTQWLRDQGFAIVQVRWAATWHHAKRNDPALPGVARLACQPATIIRYIHDNIYPQFDRGTNGPGEAGFCLTGNSGGSSQVSYALSHYGLDSIVDVLIPTGGPPHSDMARSILAPMTGPGSEYWQDDGTMNNFDLGFGIFNNGPALNRDTSPLWKARWDAASVGTGGSDYVHPATRIDFILGENDSRANGGTGMIPVFEGYYNRLKDASPTSPFITTPVIVPGTGHNVLTTEAGVEAFKTAVMRPSPSAVVTLSNLTLSGDVFQFDVNGPENLNYTVQVSTGLADWTSLHNQYGPFTFMHSVPGVPSQFYRVLWAR